MIRAYINKWIGNIYMYKYSVVSFQYSAFLEVWWLKASNM